MLEGHPERHIWGVGRHFIGSNFFWYLRDPAGNFSDLRIYSDMDIITDDQLWTPGTWNVATNPYSAWGPDVPPSMLEPDDLANLMAAFASKLIEPDLGRQSGFEVNDSCRAVVVLLAYCGADDVSTL